MADSQKNNLLVVVVVVIAFFTPSISCFTQEIELYTNEVSKRSSGLASFLEPDSWLLALGEPVFVLCTFLVASNSFARMLTSYFPSLRSVFGLVGLPLLGHLPTEMMGARDGENRDQRLLEHVDHQVKSAVHVGQHIYENNELKKKK